MQELLKRLSAKKAELIALGDVLRETQVQYERGLLDVGRYTQLQRGYRAQRYALLEQVGTLLADAGLEALAQVLEGIGERSPEEVKEALRAWAGQEVQADRLLERIAGDWEDPAVLVLSLAITVLRERPHPSPLQDAPKATPKTDLETRIRRAYQIIREYERELNLTSDPQTKARYRRRIEEQWALVDDWLDRYRRLCERLGEPPAEDIRQIIALQGR